MTHMLVILRAGRQSGEGNDCTQSYTAAAVCKLLHSPRKFSVMHASIVCFT